MKDQGPNLRDIKRKAREKQSYDWKGTFIRAIVAAVITPFKYLGGIFALVLGTVKIVLTLVGLITTVLIIAGTIIFKSVWKDSFQKPFEAVQEHSALVINLDSKLLEKASVDFDFFMHKQQPRGLYPLLHTIHKAKGDDRIEGIVLNIEDHHLSFSEIQELRLALKDFRSAKKWVIAYSYDFFETVNDPTMSYYLCCAADEIWIQPTGQLATTGISAERVFIRGALDKLKVTPYFYKAGSYKTAPEQYTEKEPSSLNQESIKNIVTGLSNILIRDVAKDRGFSKDQVRKIFEGAPWTDRQALKQGLVDLLLYKDQVRKKLKERFSGLQHFVNLKTYNLSYTSPTTTQNLTKKAKDTLKKDFHISVIEAEGLIVAGDKYALDSGTIVPAQIKSRIKQVLSSKPDALIIVLNTPGGSPLGSEIIARAITKAKRKAPVVVLTGNMCASGGYWIASSASKIISLPSTLTGSIGAFMGKFYTAEFWKDWGINWYQTHSQKNGGLFSSQIPLSEEDAQTLNNWIQESYKDFLDKVSEGRNISLDKLDSLAQGRVWLGAQAFKHDLVDGIAGFQQAIDTCLQLQKKNPKDYVVKIHFPQEPLSLKNMIRYSLITEFKAMIKQVWMHIAHKIGMENEITVRG